MIIVGQREGLAGLWVSLHDAKRYIRMQPAAWSSLSTPRDAEREILEGANTTSVKPRFGALKKVIGFTNRTKPD